MALGRETIYAALFAQLQGQLLTPTGPINYMSRRLNDANQVQPGEMPALFHMALGERKIHKLLGGPSIDTLMAQYVLYALVDEQDEIAETYINNLVDAIEDALSPTVVGQQAGIGTQTLGDLVQYAWIEGRLTDYGTTAVGRLSITVIQIEMMATH